jgi:hypothetical protein
MARTRMVRRWRRNMEVRDDAEYVDMLRDMFGDVRMLCNDTGLINPIAKLVWRICKIDGRPSRYRSEPQRQHVVAA